MLFQYPMSRVAHSPRPWPAFGPVWKEEASAYVLTAPALGLASEDVSLEMKGQVLSLSFNNEHKSDHRFVRSAGSFSWKLPSDVEGDSITASLSKGILTVTVPRRAPQEGRKIMIQDADTAPSPSENVQ